MTQPCMRAYTQLVIKTCHRRGVHAMGGMAAQIPIKNNPEANKVGIHNCAVLCSEPCVTPGVTLNAGEASWTMM